MRHYILAILSLVLVVSLSPTDAQTALPVVHIDQAFLDANPGWPKPLKTSARYVLDVDVDSPTSGLAPCASPIEIDLNSHKIIFGNTDAMSVPDGGFEAVAVGQAPTGWDLSGAAESSVKVAPNTAFLYGKNVLRWDFSGGKACTATAEGGALVVNAPGHGLANGAGVMVSDVKVTPSPGTPIMGTVRALDANRFAVDGIAPITALTASNGFYYKPQSISCRLAVPVPNRQYFASIANSVQGLGWDARTTRGVALRMEAFDPSTGKRYPDYAMVDGGSSQARSGQVIFRPTSTSVDIRITLLPTEGGTDKASFGDARITLDHFNVTPTGDAGIVATRGSSSALRGMPQVSYQAGLTSGMDHWTNTYSKANYKKAGALSVSNGSIEEGRGRGAFGLGILASYLDPNPIAVDGVTFTLGGDNAVAINAQYGTLGGATSNRTIKNCSIAYVGEFDVVLRSHIFGAIHLATGGPHGIATVDGCTIDNYPHFGITVSSPSPLNGAEYVPQGSFVVTNNKLYPNLHVTNGYGVGVSASGVLVKGNRVEVLEGRSGRGMYAEAESDHTHWDIVMEDNDIIVEERGNREYADDLSPARCVRWRNIAPRSGFRKMRLRGNRCLAKTGRKGYFRYANGLRTNLVNWVVDGKPIMNDADILIENNVFEARIIGDTDPGPQYEAASISLDNCDLGIRPVFLNNTLKSSQYGMRLLFVDSGGETVTGDIQFIDTRYEKSSEGFKGRTYASHALGYWGKSVGPITLLGDVYAEGTRRSPWLQRAMPITVDFWQRLGVAYTDMDGNPRPVPVRVTDKAAQVVQEGSTGEDGRWASPLLVASLRTVSGRLATDAKGPFTIQVGALSQTAPLDADTALIFAEPKPVPLPLGEPVQINGQTFENQGETESGYIILKKKPKARSQAVPKGKDKEKDKRKRKG